MHALVLAHEPLERSVVGADLIELDQVPVVPIRVGHRLVGVVEHGGLERHVVPFHAGDFTGLAADAGGGVDQLAEFLLALRSFAGDGAGVARDSLHLQRLAIAHLRAPPTLPS